MRLRIGVNNNSAWSKPFSGKTSNLNLKRRENRNQLILIWMKPLKAVKRGCSLFVSDFPTAPLIQYGQSQFLAVGLFRPIVAMGKIRNPK